MERVKKEVNAIRVYKKRLSGKNIRIAVLDTGIFLHKDLTANVIYFMDCISKKKYPYDDNGHGTHVSGIISSMAPNVELLVFKILDKRGSGSTKHALSAINWIIENHKQYHIRILNFSMGYLPNSNPILQKQLVEKLELLWDEGVTVITAAGNNGPNENTITVPGISRKLITVGSSDESIEKRFAYSGNGPTDCCIVKPEILCPGTKIRSLSNVDGEYQYKSGTSMSVPVVSGALALALEKNNRLRPEELKLLLYDSVSRKNKKNNNSWGILDVDNLIEML